MSRLTRMHFNRMRTDGWLTVSWRIRGGGGGGGGGCIPSGSASPGGGEGGCNP